MNVQELIAIDVHTHAEVSCRQEPDEAWAPYEPIVSLRSTRWIRRARLRT